jgi:hypothetical protein
MPARRAAPARAAERVDDLHPAAAQRVVDLARVCRALQRMAGRHGGIEQLLAARVDQLDVDAVVAREIVGRARIQVEIAVQQGGRVGQYGQARLHFRQLAVQQVGEFVRGALGADFRQPRLVEGAARDRIGLQGQQRTDAAEDQRPQVDHQGPAGPGRSLRRIRALNLHLSLERKILSTGRL